MDGAIVTGPEVEAPMYVMKHPFAMLPVLMWVQISVSTESETLAATVTDQESDGRTIVIARTEGTGGDPGNEML